MGILFGSQRSIAQLEYKYVIASVLALLLTIVCLLLSRWNLSLYLFSMVHNLYLKAIKDKTRAEISMYQAGAGFVNPDSFELYDADQIKEIIGKGEKKYTIIDDGVKKGKEKEVWQDRLYKGFAVAGYICFVTSYLLAILFFIGVIKLMNQ